MDTTLERDTALEEGPTLRKRVANDMTRESAGTVDSAVRIPFLCECSGEHCYRTVWLTGLEYETAVSDGRVLASGHAGPVPAAP